MYNPRLKDKHSLVDLARYGTEARKSIHPDVLIGEHCVKCPPFREGDILDANATVNLIGDTLNCCEVFQTFDEEGQRIAERLDNLEQTQSENYTELSDKVDSLTETHEQDIARLDDKTDNLAQNIINQERVVDISKQSEVGGKTSYLVTKQDGSHDTIIVAKGDKGDQGESFSYEDFTPEQLEALKVKGDKGDKGTSITRVQQTTVAYNDRGVNVITIDLDDGSSSQIQIRNGAGGGDSSQVRQDLQAEIARATSAENALQNNINSVNSRVDHIVEDAPEALDTLLEIAEKLHDEEDAVAALTLEISQKYTKPAGGIPSSDMSESVRASLSKADTALQEHQDISGKADLADLATVATTGEYSDLLNKPVIPTIPTNVSAFTNDAGYLTEHQDISGKANVADLATVATSGSYNDLADKPVIPSLNGYATEQWVQNQNYLTEHQDISGKADKTDLNDYLKNYIEIDPTGGHDYVEIGGIKWATMNIGAQSITDTGLYFQWGDTQGYTADQVGSGSGQKYFDWEGYKYGNGTSEPGAAGMAKYNGGDYSVLQPSDDAARANWGSNWRMPTAAEYAVLKSAVNTTWTTNYQGSGVNGLLCTDKNDSSKVLFFPACGRCDRNIIGFEGRYCDYWSRSLYTADVRSAYIWIFYDGADHWYTDMYRFYGQPVRGIYVGPESQQVPVSGVTQAEKDTWNASSTQQQVDWNQTDTTAVDYIKNKPTIPVVPQLAAVATSGDYTDLINKPTIPAAQVNSDWNASSGVAQILNKPTIPSIWTGTQAQYNAITTKDSDTIYIITSTS